MLYCVGVDHRTSIETRETLALSPSQCAQLLKVIREEQIFAEALILSTCNRTEFYLVGKEERLADDLQHMLAHLAGVKGDATAPAPVGIFEHRDAQAVEHLFRVAASLESLVVGEHEIMGQVKNAYHLACQAGTAGFLLHKLMHGAFRAGKRVMTHTQLGQGTASVSQAAVDLALRIFNSLQGRTVLLLGAGETAELAVRAAIRAGMTHLIVANRTRERAEALAENFAQWRREDAAAPQDNEVTDGGPTAGETPATRVTDHTAADPRRRFACPALSAMLHEFAPDNAPAAAELSSQAIGLEQVPQVIASVDLVISATGSPQPVLTAANVGPALKSLRHPLLMIDIAVPRDIDPALGKLSNVFLANIDALESIVSHSLQQRQAEVPKAVAIVADEVRAFTDWLASRDVVPTIKLLRERIESVGQAELKRHLNKLPVAQRPALEEFARALVNKLAHNPIRFLHELGAQSNSDTMSTIDTIRRLFKLDEEEEER